MKEKILSIWYKSLIDNSNHISMFFSRTPESDSHPYEQIKLQVRNKVIVGWDLPYPFNDKYIGRLNPQFINYIRQQNLLLYYQGKLFGVL